MPERLLLDINRNNFRSYLDGTNSANVSVDDWTLARLVIDVLIHQNEHVFGGGTWTLADNISRVFEKPWNYPEVYVPALNNMLNGGTATWEVSAHDYQHLSCGECAYNHLVNDLDQEEAELGENYIDPENGISVTEDVFGEHQQLNPYGYPMLQYCDCGVILL